MEPSPQPEPAAQEWDGVLRALHWLMAALVAVCFGTVFTRHGLLHAWAGHALLLVLAARAWWGFRGPPNARLGDFFHPPRAVAAYLAGLLPGRPLPGYAGHTPAGGPVAAAQLALLLAATVSGSVVWGCVDFSGPLWMLVSGFGDTMVHLARRAHHAAADLSLALLTVHLCGVVAGSLAGRKNLVAAMVTGRMRGGRR